MSGKIFTEEVLFRLTTCRTNSDRNISFNVWCQQIEDFIYGNGKRNNSKNYRTKTKLFSNCISIWKQQRRNMKLKFLLYSWKIITNVHCWLFFGLTWFVFVVFSEVKYSYGIPENSLTEQKIPQKACNTYYWAKSKFICGNTT